jgi:purine-nucleoside phosphorylase
MTNPIPTPHIELDDASKLAKTVLMPGDPLRAKFVAENFLENPVLFNQVRGELGYTGLYNGKEVSVMSSGMGMPSIGIYSYELFSFYGVENIIRIGTAGSYSKDLAVKDVAYATEAYSESSFAKVAFDYGSDMIKPSAELNELVEQSAQSQDINIRGVKIHSSDVFYKKGKEFSGDENTPYFVTLNKEKDLEAVEMEAFALFATAKYLGKKAACVFTISDSLVVSGQNTTSEERQTSFTNMMKVALGAAIA